MGVDMIELEDLFQDRCEQCILAKEFGMKVYEMHRMITHGTPREKREAMRTPLAYTGRTIKTIVKDAEEGWMKPWLI